MGENNFFKFLFQKKDEIPSTKLLASFVKMFPNAKNAEWVERGGHYEVIFYEGDIEKIAEFEEYGNCLLLKTNLNLLLFQGKLREVAEKYGEVMNTIKIEKENTTQFEIIVRDAELTRYLLILDEEGNELKFEKL